MGGYIRPKATGDQLILFTRQSPWTSMGHCQGFGWLEVRRERTTSCLVRKEIGAVLNPTSGRRKSSTTPIRWGSLPVSPGGCGERRCRHAKVFLGMGALTRLPIFRVRDPGVQTFSVSGSSVRVSTLSRSTQELLCY